tara:strand:+ start:55232 stop:55657 length:426 start_codon:yes stop_codon:yes gene_type:complete
MGCPAMEKQEEQERIQITQAVMGLLDEWSLDTKQMQAILLLPEKVRARAFQKFRDGKESFPDDTNTLRRANYLLRIADALRTTYPRNPKMAGRWIKQRHRRFGGRTPLTMILQDGEGGLIAVLAELDCTFSWDITGSQDAK